MADRIEIYNADHDEVIDSFVGTGKTTYQFALDNLLPLINRFDAQRKLQDKKFYKRLQKDLIDGCIMPPLTIAFIRKKGTPLLTSVEFSSYVNENISKGYILDGMQRLNTLSAAAEALDHTRSLYLNVIVSKSQDKLLYRMITLNNGQRPMTPRHQIEILTSQMFDFSALENIAVQTEKERADGVLRGAFNLGDISKGYLAFLTGNVNNENNKIIDEKMDEILVSRVLDARDNAGDHSFEDIMALIDKLCENLRSKKWFKVNNNLIGFCAGIKSSYDQLNDLNPSQFADSLDLFESGFDALNASKVNLGKYRRQFSKEFIEKYSILSEKDQDEITEYFVEFTS
jgi:hypothetical protein